MKSLRLYLAAFLCLFAFLPAFAAEENEIKGSFAWGADAGATVDLTGSDLSAVDIDAFFGYKRGWINFIGAGVGVEFPVSSSSRFYNFFADFRTNFVNRPTPFFALLRCGVTESYLPDNINDTGFYGSLGMGINLARSSRFTSYILMAYTFSDRHAKDLIPGVRHDNISAVTFKIGISF